MGLYTKHVLPRIVDAALDNEGVAAWRSRCVEGLAGVVVEPGFGSGLNVPLYPAEVTRVYAVDPAELGQKLAAERLADSPVQVEFVGLNGETLPLDGNSCDAGLLTFTLCTIPDAAAALQELRRVIRPGGGLHFLEHGGAPDADVQKWQRRLEPVQKVMFEGCHLTRSMETLITDAGFAIDWADSSYASGPRPYSWFTVGRATNAKN